MARRYTTVFIWDLDKTYLVSHFESLRQLIKVPFEKAEDKIAVPGAVSLIKGLRRSIRRRGRAVRVYFVSASPPQIAGAIKEKLAPDGIDYDGIAFKNQMRHLMSARFAAVREQIGYKLEQLLRHAREFEPGSRLLLFGDDWESDPFVYSLFSDIVEGRVDAARVMRLLARAAVDEHYASRIEQLLSGAFVGVTVDHVFILRQRPAPAEDFEPFGARLTWVDSYFEASLKLFGMGCLDVAGVLDVAAELHRSPAELADCLMSFERRGGVHRSALGPVRRELVRAGLMTPVAGGAPWRRLAAWCRRRLGPPAIRRRALPLPPYEDLVDRWSRKGRKEAIHNETRADAGRRADDRGG